MTNRYDPADFESVHAFVENMERLKMIAEQKTTDKHDWIIENQNDWSMPSHVLTLIILLS